MYIYIYTHNIYIYIYNMGGEGAADRDTAD